MPWGLGRLVLKATSMRNVVTNKLSVSGKRSTRKPEGLREARKELGGVWFSWILQGPRTEQNTTMFECPCCNCRGKECCWKWVRSFSRRRSIQLWESAFIHLSFGKPSWFATFGHLQAAPLTMFLNLTPTEQSGYVTAIMSTWCLRLRARFCRTGVLREMAVAMVW